MGKKKTQGEDEAMSISTPADESTQITEETKETSIEPKPMQPAAPTDFPMSLEEYGICRGLAASVTAGLKAFLKGDARPRKLEAWDRALGRFEQA
jgi:hypothetical protein